ncbi:DDHD-domain-containing protein [Hanseniaspora valbyensis NRRL Y-1626]|uniref:DDHD-domain-containing protein n=2 Tax=Hanseniaspora valbyensis NRRL Y-1626 TaxID=766949 RepID=A0A1B7TEJ2_9ASCO|nr:DDHD-domain-containing protein [Hanseniaspora valbyensis NRRL Y-1626]
MIMKPIYWGENNSKLNIFDDIYEIRRGDWLESVNTTHENDNEKNNKKKLVAERISDEFPIPVFISEQIEDILDKDQSYLTKERLLTIRDEEDNKIIGKIFMQNQDTIFFIPKDQLSIYDNILTLKLVKENILTVGLKKYIRQKPIEFEALKELTNFEQLQAPKKIHLSFCVHGIGQTLGSKYEYVNFPKTISIFRDNIKKTTAINKIYSNMESNSKIQVLPITWRDKLDFNHPSSDQDLPSFRDICPSGAMIIRSLIGDIGLDILLYDNNYYKEKIIESVINELNSKFDKFKQLHNDIELEISLIGHSLGSLILFDILNNKQYYEKLNFRVINFFGIGSPVSIFKLIQRDKLKDELYCDNYYNVFHECDPIGYRMEPLLDRSLSTVNPVPLETLSSPDLIIDKVKNLNVLSEYISGLDIMKNKNGLDVAKLDGKLSPEHVKKIHNFNTFGRIDYVIKSKLLDLDMINALKSHVCYFEEFDLINFIIKKLLAKKQKLSIDEALKLNKVN